MDRITVLKRWRFLLQYAKINLNPFYGLRKGLNMPQPAINIGEGESLAHHTTQVLEQLNTDDIALIDFQQKLDVRHVMSEMITIFGNPLHDSGIEKTSYSPIYHKKGSKYFSHTCLTQPLHTDDAHIEETPDIIALYCAHQSKRGGISTLVHLGRILEHAALSNDTLKAAQSSRALTIKGVKGIIKKPYLKNIKGEMQVCHPAFAFEIKCSELVANAFCKIQKIIHKHKNQIRHKLAPGQILIINNKRVLHARTKFSKNSDRMLYRFCFNKTSTKIENNAK